MTITNLSKPVNRLVSTKHGKIVVTISTHGISIRGPNTKRKLFINWVNLAKASDLPENMKASYTYSPLDWLVENQKK